VPDGNDELFATFVTESNEHLADIENQLMEMEEAGADADPDLINQVFRAIHSTKGTAGYLGLKSINNLAHETESVLNRIRNNELVPTAQVVDVLLRAVDLLRNMVNNVDTSNDVDVSELCVELMAINGNDQVAAQPVGHMVDIELDDGDLAFVMVSSDLLVAQQQSGCHIYVLKVDLFADLESCHQDPVQFLNQVCNVSELIDSYLSTAGLVDLDSELPESLMLTLMVGSTYSTDELAGAIDIAKTNVHHIAPPEAIDWSGPTPVCPPASAAEAPTPALTPAPQTTESPAMTANPVSAQPAPPAQPAKPAADSAPASPAIPTTTRKETSLRVQVEVLDKLMNLAGELVLGRNQLLQLSTEEDPRGLESIAARLDQVTSELQEAIMQTRMQPVGTVFNRFPRIVRDLSGSLGKECSLEIEGRDVELDKTIIEGIGDPLTHLIRNAVDHGIEMPDVRVDNNKSAAGTVYLSAFHQSGKVHICIRDNGAGIDAKRLRQKAIEKEILTAEQAASMSDREAIQLIFHPGFSLAKQVTDVSGRGVGMDVVKTNIEKLGGEVDIETEVGLGTTINIKLPLTLAIIPSMIVRCSDERYAIPQVSISELVRIKATDVGSKIERVKDAEVLRLRGSLLPLVRLNEVLGTASKYRDPQQQDLRLNNRVALADRRRRSEDDCTIEPEQRSGDDRREVTPQGSLSIIVVETGSLRYGLIVDSLYDSEEIVVKPLGRHMKNCTCFAGATILGDGAVALILDITGVAAHHKLSSTTSDELLSNAAVSDSGSETQTMMLFNYAASEQFGIPMDLISRIERINSSQIDSVGGQHVLQYRGASLPLILLDQQITAKPHEELDKLFVVVCKVAGREVGLIAPVLVDIRESDHQIDTSTFNEPGVLGSTIIDGITTRLIDVVGLVGKAFPDWYVGEQKLPLAGNATPLILLVEDSTFFRRQMKSFFESADYEVIDCEDGLEAWNMLQESDRRFDLVITDIEMPIMDGIELTRHIKGDDRFKHLPVVAVTSLASETDVQTGIKAGVDDYQIKLDRDQLMAAVKKFLKSADAGASLAR
jgi:two-component system chemotaxis sensor kinase CheA